MEEKENIITLIDEDGQEEDFEIIVTFESKGNEYVILALAGSDEESDAFAFKIVYDNENSDEFSLISIEDDEEYDDVLVAYETLMEQEM
ncbi:MAG TPA: DUF1292 domain-containing protein [Clostridia bacterium]|nr:DUF1292 domain-containing protein [Clostridia bacterium]